MPFYGKITLPPLPPDLYKQWKLIRLLYNLDTFAMWCLSALAVSAWAGENPTRLSELAKTAREYVNPWTKRKETGT